MFDFYNSASFFMFNDNPLFYGPDNKYDDTITNNFFIDGFIINCVVNDL